MVPFADVISYLDRHQGAMTFFATLALIGVTLAYVLVNWRVVREMREARRLSVLPNLAIKLARVGPAHAFVAVQNAGSGTAFDVAITLAFEPRDPSQDQRDERTWRTPSIAPGAQHEFIPMTPGNGGIMDINALAATYERITLSGSMRDALGEEHAVSDTFDNLREWRELLHDSRERWVDVPEKRLAAALGDTLGKSLKDVAAAIRGIRSSP
jgi:hypothetical protein